MEKVFDIFGTIMEIVLLICVGILILVGICYFTGIIEIHHLVAIPGVFEKYEICFMGNEVYHWFVGNVTVH